MTILTVDDVIRLLKRMKGYAFLHKESGDWFDYLYEEFTTLVKNCTSSYSAYFAERPITMVMFMVYEDILMESEAEVLGSENDKIEDGIDLLLKKFIILNEERERLEKIKTLDEYNFDNLRECFLQAIKRQIENT